MVERRATQEAEQPGERRAGEGDGSLSALAVCARSSLGARSCGLCSSCSEHQPPPAVCLRGTASLAIHLSGVVPACRCCTTTCTTSSGKKAGAPVSRQTVRALRRVHLPWSTRAPLSLHSVTAAGCSSGDSTASLSTGLPRLPRLNKVAANPVPDLAEARPDIEEGEEESIAEDADVDAIREWELDFCSRPMLDGRGKKLWELVVCDSRRQLQFTRFFPNNVINSVTLRDTLLYIMDTLEVPKPEKIRFFRSQMQTIITKSCKELDIQPVPSQRCVTLIKWLEERNETVYTQHPGYQEGASPLLLQQQAIPLDLPDALRGEEWTFVQLPFEDVLEEMGGVQKGGVFGSVLDLDTLKIDLSSDIMIPGVAVASSRATPLAAWTNALELASLEVDTQRSCLVLSTGVADRWRYAFYRKSRQTDAEGEAWEAAKKKCGGLHFLAVQASLESELCTGFWLLMDVPMSPV